MPETGDRQPLGTPVANRSKIIGKQSSFPDPKSIRGAPQSGTTIAGRILCLFDREQHRRAGADAAEPHQLIFFAMPLVRNHD
jgi:hypothetical protein